MAITFLQRNIFQRLFGICATNVPQDESGWNYDSGQLTINLEKIPELSQPGTAIRLEGKNLPKRILVIFEKDQKYRAIHNRCSHFGHRRLDYVPGTETIQCCSLNKSTYTLTGEKIFGPAPKPVPTYPVEISGKQLLIRVT